LQVPAPCHPPTGDGRDTGADPHPLRVGRDTGPHPPPPARGYVRP
jgi:hypothetical protein